MWAAASKSVDLDCSVLGGHVLMLDFLDSPVKQTTRVMSDMSDNFMSICSTGFSLSCAYF